MSRGFFGGGGLGKGRNPFGSKSKDMSAQFSRKRKKSVHEMMEERSTHKVKSQKDILSDMLMDRMFNPNKSNNFKLPGTGSGVDEDNSGGRSKGYLSAMKLMQEKALKKKARKNDQKVKVQPKAFGGGGRVDANGKVMNAKGQVVATINLETGIIKDAMGMKVGKYKPFSFGMDNKLEKLIEKSAVKKGYGSINEFKGM